MNKISTIKSSCARLLAKKKKDCVRVYVSVCESVRQSITWGISYVLQTRQTRQTRRTRLNRLPVHLALEWSGEVTWGQVRSQQVKWGHMRSGEVTWGQVRSHEVRWGHRPSRDQWHRQCNVLALLAADTSVGYSSSANPLNTEKLRHKRMLLALSVNIRIFSATNIEGPPNIMGTLYLQY